MEHNRLEIILLACGILILVALLSVILYLGNRKRNQERRDSQESQRNYSSHSHAEGRECLFKEVFSDHPDHDSPLLDGQGSSFIDTVRKRTQSVAGVVQHELRDLGRGKKTGEKGEEHMSLLNKGSDEANMGRSTEEEITPHRMDTLETEAPMGRDTRRRHSSLVKHDKPEKRKSQDENLVGEEKD